LAIKLTLKSIDNSNACPYFDDTIVHKPHTQPNEIVEHYWNRTINKSVKGINILSCTYQTKDISFPINYRVIRKNQTIIDKNGKEASLYLITDDEFLNYNSSINIYKTVKYWNLPQIIEVKLFNK